MDPKSGSGGDNGWEITSRYTREEALADGVLIDVSKLARQACFIHPVAMTVAAHAACVTVPDDVTGQSVEGRLWDVLQVLRWRLKRLRPGATSVYFSVDVRNDDEAPPEEVQLRAVCGPGDDEEPVITVMLAHED